MYKIKEYPEDFVVKEVTNVVIEPGPYHIFLMKKKDFSTMKALELLAQHLRCKLRDIGFAGNKDRQAVTEQYISIRGIPKERIESFNNENIYLEYVGTSAKQITLGRLVGNKFEIILRDVKKQIKTRTQFVNYFGEQRFSTHNARIGKLLLQKNYKEAVNLMLESKTYTDKITAHLAKTPNDYIGAIGIVPQKTMSLFVNSYQSYIWNKSVSNKLNSKTKIEISGEELCVSDDYNKDFEMPLVGFETEVIPKEMQDVLDEEKITSRDFVNRQISYICAGGSFRKVFAEVKDLEIMEEDSVVKLSFQLPKGSYATVFIRQLFI